GDPHLGVGRHLVEGDRRSRGAGRASAALLRRDDPLFDERVPAAAARAFADPLRVIVAALLADERGLRSGRAGGHVLSIGCEWRPAVKWRPAPACAPQRARPW